MQELPVEPELAADSVDRVAGDRQTDRGEVDADLVHPPRLEADAKQRVTRQPLLELELRDRLARRLRVERLARRIPAVTPDRRLDPPGARARLPADEREVLALERAVSDELLEASRTPRRSVRRRAGPMCPGRAGGRSRAGPPPPRPRRARPARARACRPRAPAPGWTTTPAGLSTTSRWSSS